MYHHLTIVCHLQLRRIFSPLSQHTRSVYVETSLFILLSVFLKLLCE